MSSRRLKAQFDRLFDHFQGQDGDTQLDVITELLCCTRRNARMVLNKLEDAGWIEWQPESGRGKLSTLRFKYHRDDIASDRAKHWLDEGKIDKALDSLEHDMAKLNQVLQQYLGVQHKGGKQTLRLPYYRPLPTLNPTQPFRRSEVHIMSQIFSGLTKLDHNEQVVGDVAHHWQQCSATHWRFYLRPNIHFHNGLALSEEIVKGSLLRTRDFRLFSHIERVDIVADNTIDIYLSHPDHHLPRLLTEVVAKLQLPLSLQSDDYAQKPIGTGPFQVAQNHPNKLTLTAFDDYFGFRPLLDQVEVWVVDDSYSTIVYPSLSTLNIAPRTGHDEVALDPGSLLLMLNRRSGIATRPDVADYLSAQLNGLQLMRDLPQHKVNELGLVPAYGIKPGWMDHRADQRLKRPANLDLLTLAYQAKHPVLTLLAELINQKLAQQGIEVELVAYDQTLEQDVDVCLKAMGLATHRQDALAAWLLDYSQLDRFANEADFAAWQAQIRTWQAEPDHTFPGRAIGKGLIESQHVVPLFHCWLGINQDHCGALQNTKCNALGWFDFSSVWVNPTHA